MLSEIGFKFKILVLSETWYQDESIADNSLFHLPNYKIVHLNRKEKSRDGGVKLTCSKSMLLLVETMS